MAMCCAALKPAKPFCECSHGATYAARWRHADVFHDYAEHVLVAVLWRFGCILSFLALLDYHLLRKRQPLSCLKRRHTPKDGPHFRAVRASIRSIRLASEFIYPPYCTSFLGMVQSRGRRRHYYTVTSSSGAGERPRLSRSICSLNPKSSFGPGPGRSSSWQSVSADSDGSPLM